MDLSPAFDNGSSLGYNYPEARTAKLCHDKNWLSAYAAKGTHHLRIEPDGDKFRHDELIRVLIEKRPEFRQIAEKIISFDMEQFRKMLNDLTLFDVPFMFLPDRAEFTARIVAAKRNLLEQAIG